MSLFFLVMVSYWWFAGSIVVNYETVLKKGTVYSLCPEPVDPFDAFRGRYVDLNFWDARKIKISDSDASFKGGQTVYLEIADDEQGCGQFTNPSLERPIHNNYLKTTIRHYNPSESELLIALPMELERYYLNEALAEQAEKVYNQLSRSNRKEKPAVTLDVKLYKGTIAIEQLYFEGKPVGEYLRGLE